MTYDPNLKRVIYEWPYEANLARVAVFIMVYRSRREKDQQRERDRIRERLVMMSVLRLLGYPVVLILCLPAECIMQYLIFTNSRNTPFGDTTGRVKAILTGMIGIFNLIIFFFNPSFSSAISELFKKSTCPQSKSRSISYASTKLDGGDTILPHFESWIWKNSNRNSTPSDAVLSAARFKKVKFAQDLREIKGQIEQVTSAQLQRNSTSASTNAQCRLVFSPSEVPGSHINDNGYNWVMRRRFCADSEIHYILPNDEEEMNRLISQHYFFRSLFSNRNFLSPVQDVLRDGAMVLDIGCGPGTWTMEMATEYPRSQFHGIDICDMFPQQIKPVNCHFQIANILKKLSFDDASFDFIYIRCMSLGVFQSEWVEVIADVLRIIKPGGYIEFVEADYAIKCDGKALRKITDGIYNTLRARDIHPSWTRRIGEYLKYIGVEDVNALSLQFPVSRLSREDGGSGVEYWMQFLSAMRPHLAQVMYISPEEYDDLQQNVYQELSAERFNIDVVCTYGRKPFNITHEVEDRQVEVHHK
ncbi:uncharacterized protein VTP21DRAFT_6134 [Calcarisporiella thermophila]|uniref:uncharacterized protein n=1 Tax=Calcarisporiella thermophila TaxID=911321 RepID=UPI00374476BA